MIFEVPKKQVFIKNRRASILEKIEFPQICIVKSLRGQGLPFVAVAIAENGDNIKVDFDERKLISTTKVEFFDEGFDYFGDPVFYDVVKDVFTHLKGEGKVQAGMLISCKKHKLNGKFCTEITFKLNPLRI